MSRLVPESVRVLGIDPLGVDVEINGRRHRHRLAARRRSTKPSRPPLTRSRRSRRRR
jgi:hypothetical protein